MNKSNVIKIMLGLLSLVLIFHLCILTEIFSYKAVWAGRLKTKSEMYVFESVSIAINILLIVVLFLKSKALDRNITPKAIDIILWIFVVIFALNTIGNLFAENIYERVIGTIFTLLFSIMCWFIIKKDK